MSISIATDQNGGQSERPISKLQRKYREVDQEVAHVGHAVPEFQIFGGLPRRERDRDSVKAQTR